jgi:hypothetical protein
MTCCDETPDFIFPLSADIYYPIIDQGAYGNLKKQWVLDRTIACAFNPAGRKFKQDVQTDPKIDVDNSIDGRTRNDITNSTRNDNYSLTNIIITNIRDRNGNIVYNESAGPRIGLSTIWEVATLNPVVGPLGTIEYFNIVLRRSENQAADL